ncbi:MAG: bifunctional metallophosphatase/5'-nucleotidase, partial [Bacilli bacterium]|nr:bifunctional metallophosphatase/5'-nucleotidase [Bacilli bacterium]
SIYSNFNHGALITDIMNYVQYDARTVGNHDFDWGLTPLLENKLRSYEGYSVPVLAGNVYGYDFDSHIEDDRQMEEIGVKSVVKELDTGCRVGIVGVIGSNQITSISTIYAKDVCFKNHIEMAKEEAARLRDEEECDVMILSIHAGQADVLGAGLNEYFDVALCGHTHRRETSKDGGMPVVQFGSYTQAIGKVELSFSASTKRVTSTKVTTLSSSTIYNEVDDVDPTIQKLIDDYGKDCDDIANGVVAYSVDGYFDKGKTLPNLMCEAIYDQALREGFDVDFAYCNEARHYIGNDYGTTRLYFADLFEAFPFDNEVFIITVTACEVRSEILGYNSIYHDPDKPISIDEGKTYTIASIDFLAFHTNSRREFDFFPSMANYAIENIQNLSYNYREILARYLIGNGYAEEGAKSLKASDYSSTLPQFDQGRYY